MSDKERFRPDILKTGDNIFFHTKGFSLISRGIRLLTCSYWNHVGKFVAKEDKKLILFSTTKPLEVTHYGYVIEAVGRGVVATPLEKYIGNKSYDLCAQRIKMEAFDTTQEYYDGIALGARNMCSSLDNKYDRRAIIYLAIAYIFKGYWKKGAQYIPLVGNPLQARNKFFCSELVCQSDFGISKKTPFLYKGLSEQLCDTTTPKDCKKSIWTRYVCGKVAA